MYSDMEVDAETASISLVGGSKMGKEHSERDTTGSISRNVSKDPYSSDSESDSESYSESYSESDSESNSESDSESNSKSDSESDSEIDSDDLIDYFEGRQECNPSGNSQSVLAEKEHRSDAGAPISIKELIAATESKKIYLGPVKIKSVLSHTHREKMNDKEKPLFDYINTVLQHPPCVRAARSRYSRRTLKNQAYVMTKYIEFMASIGKTVENFKVDGTYIVLCLRNLAANFDLTHFQVSDFATTIADFQPGLTFLQEMIAMYKLRDCENSYSRKFKALKKVPNLDKLDFFMNSREDQVFESAKNSYPNKGLSIQVRYNKKNIKRMMIDRLNQTGRGNKADVFDGINARLEFLLGYHYFLPSSKKRHLEVSDFVWSKEDTDMGLMTVLGFHVQDDKNSFITNRIGAARNKNVELCFISAFAMSLWFRFDFDDGLHSGKNLPNFLDKRDWYPIKVLFDSKSPRPGRRAIGYDYSCKLTTETLHGKDFSAAKDKHAGRLVNAQRAATIDYAHTERQDMWYCGTREQHLGWAYPFDFLHSSAGFAQEESHFIDRDVDVPLELKRKIFPWLESVKLSIENRDDQENLPRPERDDTIPLFLKMLDDFRSIIIQDLALLIDISPECIYSQHEITADPLFVKFKAELRGAMDTKVRENRSGNVQRLQTLLNSWPFR